MTKEELDLIGQFDEHTAFRVLEVSEPEDYKILRTKCADINLKKDKELKLFINRLKVTLEEEQGVGIAAPQVGISRNLFLLYVSTSREHRWKWRLIRRLLAVLKRLSVLSVTAVCRYPVFQGIQSAIPGLMLNIRTNREKR